MNSRQVFGVPGVAAEVGGFDLGGPVAAEGGDGFHIEAEVAGAVGGEVAPGEAEEAGGGVEAASILGVGGAGVLLLQVDEGAGELDEALEKSVVGAGGAQPEVLEHVVGLVVAPLVEEGKPPGVAGVRGEFAVPGAAHLGLDAIAFFHSRVCVFTYARGAVPDKRMLKTNARTSREREAE